MSAEDMTGEAEIYALVKRLARPHSSGGDVVERAALLASGSDFAAVMAWIADHAGVAETMASGAPRRGLHGPRVGLSGDTESRTPLRFVLPAGALAEPSARRQADGPGPPARPPAGGPAPVRTQ